MPRLLDTIRAWFKTEETVIIPFKMAKGDEGAISLGHYASQLVNNPALDAAFKKLEADIIMAWKTSPGKARMEREHLYYRMEGLAQVRLKLAGMVSNMILDVKIAKQNEGQAEGNPEQESA